VNRTRTAFVILAIFAAALLPLLPVVLCVAVVLLPPVVVRVRRRAPVAISVPQRDGFLTLAALRAPPRCAFA
jgi:hypothetical protein